MRRRITTIILVILFISGVGVMAYPWISRLVNASSQTHVIRDYQEEVSHLDNKEIHRAKEIAKQYDHTEVSSGVEDPFMQENGSEQGEQVVHEGNYANILNVGETMGYLKIPKLKLESPIYHGTSELTMQQGVGHMEGTSMPVGGKSTHCVLASHSGLPNAKLFTDLDKLVVGDHFFLCVLDETLTYEVDQIEIVLPSDTSKLEIVPNKDYVTLLTCTPIGTNTHRLLVRGSRIPNKTSTDCRKTGGTVISHHAILSMMWWMLPLMAVIIGLFILGFRRKKK